MAAVDFVTGYITNYVDGMVRPYIEQGAAAVGDVAGGVLFAVRISNFLSQQNKLTIYHRQATRSPPLVVVSVVQSMDTLRAWEIALAACRKVFRYALLCVVVLLGFCHGWDECMKRIDAG